MIANGDLSLEGGSFQTVNGKAKLQQDLRCAILEPIGTDSMHLDYGSVIDGGRLPTGEIVNSPIGETDQKKVRLMIDSEIKRIITQHKLQQLARIRQDRLTYARSTVEPGEVIQSLDAIKTLAFLDGLFITIKLSTFEGQSIDMQIPLGG